jgi:hypothetical protein
MSDVTPPAPQTPLTWPDLIGRLIPDQRGWGMILAGTITLYLLNMIKAQPVLLTNAAFMTFSGTMTAGTIFLVFQNLYGGTKASTDNNKATNTTMNTLAAQPAQVVTAPQPQAPVK